MVIYEKAVMEKNKSGWLVAVMLMALAGAAGAREWLVRGAPGPVEADFEGSANGFVLLRGEDGVAVEVALPDLSVFDRRYVSLLMPPGEGLAGPLNQPGKPLTRAKDYEVKEQKPSPRQVIEPEPGTVVSFPGEEDALPESYLHFTASDGWALFPDLKPSIVAKRYLERLVVNHEPAVVDKNIRLVAYGTGTVVIPHGPDYQALTLFSDQGLKGERAGFVCYQNYGSEAIGALAGTASSFVLKRGYTATLAENEDGTGVSRNYVAQDADVVIEELPAGLQDSVRFIRVFPWRWTAKKGIAGGITGNLDVGWFYDWNIGARSSLDVEYVAIKQKRYWPGMNQNWKDKGINHLLGYNEPDRPDQANMSVEDAIRGWPELLGTGLRLGSPSTSDGGLNWLYQFMDRAEKEGLRVDFVAVHYYRAIPNPGDERAAADQFYGFLKRIHDRVQRPLWVTEWNNGANWTNAPDPDAEEQRKAIEAMIEMLDETPFVERYAPFNWVEDCRRLVWDDGSLTPAGVSYRDHRSPIFYQQPRSQED
ncbi:glycosyl hydrolase [Roseibacillus ishigakijimensis]|uniref:Asl1-like glycosyl hydrolase catalytic domain-containing protein n=1 Tax=Roseibacillus ishigakijimensis TaxID=454146 RepID=A0A934VJZ4_9BACT|nr:glycosyl hydrolase [Roseibacillus ishigakijimensis]MBK1833119.1 hypothetical protein [Roseibacillus ishigakijimensis]